MKTDKFFKDLFFYGIGLLFLLGFFYLLQFLTYKVIPAENKEIFTGVIETLKNGVILILGYFYGSSKGSSDKNQLLNDKPPEP
jgi:hypothetical protein